MASVKPHITYRSLRIFLPIFAFLLTGFLSTRRAIWNDEGATIYRIALPWSDFLAASLHRNDLVHATYYALLKILNPIIGYELVYIRLVSALFVALSVFGVGKLCRIFLSERGALLAQVIFLAMPVTLDFGSEARSYSLATTAVIWLSYFFFQILQKASSGERITRHLVLFITLSILSTHLFIYLILFHLVTLSYLVLIHEREQFKVFSGATILVTVACLPIILQSSTQTSQIKWLSRTFLQSIGDTISIPLASTFGVVTFLGSILTLSSIVFLIRRYVILDAPIQRLFLFALLLSFLPALIIISVSVVHPLFTQRYLAPFSLGFALIAIIAITSAPKLLRRSTGAALIALSLLATFAHFDTAGKDLWGEKKETLAAHIQQGDSVMATKAHYERVLVLDSLNGISIVQQAGSPRLPVGIQHPPLITIADKPQRIFLVPSKKASAEQLSILKENGYRLVADYPVGPGTILEFALN